MMCVNSRQRGNADRISQLRRRIAEVIDSCIFVLCKVK